MPHAEPGEFDGKAFRAMDAKRRAEGLTGARVADSLWDQSAGLNLRRRSLPISPSPWTGVVRRQSTTSQHALFILRWLERPAADFV
jgi:hypothetical protein